MSIEAMKQWREALRKARRRILTTEECHAAITSIDQAIAEAEKQEPVAMQMDVIVVNLVREGINKHRARELAEHFIKHTHPQPKPAGDKYTSFGLMGGDKFVSQDSLKRDIT